MSESSLPPFGPARNPRALPRPAKTLARSRAAAALNKVRGLTRRGRTQSGTQDAPDPLENRAARVVREYLDAHAESVERAARLHEKAGRLESEGTPSESARNRAERAHGEIAAGLVALRARFVATVGREGARAFDRVVTMLAPAYGPPVLPD
ncbi:MAG TPA: hypothetical protein VKA51_15070 [Rubrobacteraceae bacterium]|nr:hypothetical protein [Rubrobacteraceae bacterium]